MAGVSSVTVPVGYDSQGLSVAVQVGGEKLRGREKKRERRRRGKIKGR